jgi:hypothetical protein
MSGISRLGLAVLLALAALGAIEEVSAVSRSADSASQLVLESGNLRSIASWLKSSGRNGYLAAEVADAVGIPRQHTEEVLNAKQRGFKNGDVLRIAQISADERRDFMLFMVQRPDGEVHFYVSSVRDGLKKAFVSIPSRKVVVPMEEPEAQERFQMEVSYWHDKVVLR